MIFALTFCLLLLRFSCNFLRLAAFVFICSRAALYFPSSRFFFFLASTLSSLAITPIRFPRSNLFVYSIRLFIGTLKLLRRVSNIFLRFLFAFSFIFVTSVCAAFNFVVALVACCFRFVTSLWEVLNCCFIVVNCCSSSVTFAFAVSLACFASFIAV